MSIHRITHCRRRRNILCTIVMIVLMTVTIRFMGDMVYLQNHMKSYRIEKSPAAPRDTHVEQDTAMRHENLEYNQLLGEIGDDRSLPIVVLVLSSMPRGGSTLMTTLLSSIPGSVVIFEPLWIVERNASCYQDQACVRTHMVRTLTCRFTEDFETWLKGKGLFIQYFNQQARDCKRANDNKTCLKEMDLRAICKAAPVLIVKVIRSRLAWIWKLLDNYAVQFKVIHLTRDPRGSITSIQKQGWNADPHTRCSDLEDDLVTYRKMKDLFPYRVTQVRLEHLCLSPMKTAGDVFNFIFGNRTLPFQTEEFIKSHMLSGNTNAGQMSTVKDSSQEFQAWRFKITDDQLKSIEKEPSCQRAIIQMGHTLFGSQAAARSNSTPLIINP